MNDSCLVRDTEEKAQDKVCNDRGRDKSPVATGHGTPGASRSWRRQEDSAPDPSGIAPSRRHLELLTSRTVD